jgi:hypothetical protein
MLNLLVDVLVGYADSTFVSRNIVLHVDNMHNSALAVSVCACSSELPGIHACDESNLNHFLTFAHRVFPFLQRF